MTLLRFSYPTEAKVVDDSSLELYFSDGTQHLVSVEHYLQQENRAVYLNLSKTLLILR